MTSARALAAEFLGSALLLSAIVGSGIMAQRLFPVNPGLALLANAVATAGVLAALILALAPISGAHFNPAVTLAEAWRGALPWSAAGQYTVAQILGALCGTALANGMFGLPAFFMSEHSRSGIGMLVSEFVATFGLIVVILGCVRNRPTATAYAVAGFIAGAYWFTPSTSFANPAVTIARSLTGTFSGIRIQDVPGFVAIQIVAAIAASAVSLWLGRDGRDSSAA